MSEPNGRNGFPFLYAAVADLPRNIRKRPITMSHVNWLAYVTLLLLGLAQPCVAASLGGRLPRKNNPPVVSLTVPSSVTGSVTIQLSANDRNGVVGVSLYLDNSLIKTYSMAATIMVSLSYPWDSTQVADGTHSLQAKATDFLGAVGSSPLATVTVNNATVPGEKVGTVNLGVGWATFGQVVPQGVATGGLQIGSLPTQSDVKTRWPDGSIKFAVVSAHVPAAGSYDVTASSATVGGFTPAVPVVSASFTIGTQLYVATLPPAPSTDNWLAGPVAQEWRSVVTPTAGGTSHPFLQVIFDVRSYSDGSNRIDMTVENVTNVVGATSVTYAAAVTVNGQQVLQQSALTHYWMTRWRKTFSTNTLADVTPDFEPVFQAKALPRYLSIVTENNYSTSGPQFGILGGGDFHNPMNDHGGRPEIAPYPDWVARYLVHAAHASGPATKAYMLAMDEQAGAWPMHLRKTDGTPQTIDDDPDFWLDPRADAGHGPLGDWSARGPLQPEPNNHQPSIGYQSYLVTGDRFFVDELGFWANYSLIGTFEDSYYNRRGGGFVNGTSTPVHAGSWGLLLGNEVRGIGWGLRTLADAAAWLPDVDSLKSYFTIKVANNLTELDAVAAAETDPLGLSLMYLPSYVPPSYRLGVIGTSTIYAPWQHNYVAWAIDHAQNQGFAGGGTERDRLAGFQLSLFTAGSNYLKSNGAPAQLAIGTTTTQYATLADVYSATQALQNAGYMLFVPFQGYYGVDARLALMIAVKGGASGASDAYAYLDPIVTQQVYTNGVSDAGNRAGWALR